MAFAIIEQYKPGIRPKVSLPTQPRKSDGEAGPNFRYDHYKQTLALGHMVVRMTLPQPVTGGSVAEAIDVTIKGSEGLAAQAMPICKKTADGPLILGRTGTHAQLHLAVLAPVGEPAGNIQTATLLKPDSRYTQLAIATVNWPDILVESRTGQQQAALSAMAFVRQLDDPLEFLSRLDNAPSLQS